MKTINGNTTAVAVLKSEFNGLKEQNSKEHSQMMSSMQKIEDKIDITSITRQEVEIMIKLLKTDIETKLVPIARLVYGTAGLILTGFILAVIAVVFRIKI